MRLIAIASLLTAMLTFGPFPGRDWMPSWVVGNPVLLAAGDIADCGSTGDDAMASLVEQMPGTVATLGDNAYPSGTSEQFAKCYDPTWGRVKWRTRPTPGDHDYGTHGAGPYFAYFGALAGDPDKGYYSYDLGTWHIVALNSNCEKAGGCGPGTAQELWLKADLAAHPAACILAYWHHPLYSSADMLGNNIEVRTFWQDLRAAGADVVLNGHVHNYERFAPQDDRGAADPRGIREFVVGTGGRDHRPTTDIAANSEAHIEDTFGVLKLTLRAGSYDWEFVPEPGKTETDSGSARCDGAANSVATG